ncbi:MAG: hypothetical protein ABIZ80_05200, partial [Bryobacteraceae bacterium]
PIGMPQDTQFDSYFGAQAGAPDQMSLACFMPPTLKMAAPSAARGGKLFRALFSKKAEADFEKAALALPAETADDKLLALASSMEADGGMPGSSRDERTLATIVALLAFLSAGHTSRGGAFRSHVARLIAYLQSASGDTAKGAVDWARAVDAGTRPAPGAEWVDRAAKPSKWRQEVAALRA